ncbi:MAG: glycoside hydrolase family 15 protein [Methylobacter sp.]|uniref:glycoside hydrolase family 15 protein n=1 Tax=Methylobacter sp. TaxID=2051955 RepID=UPI0025831A90|nr:glycoside hydrolase family 15 protein [Methylobacter sp.]MCL7419682.1 glycoside hydrolase family 15 protein [Methylobacter sp.]
MKIMIYKKIADYGLIGNKSTVALVGKDGSIDWLCLPFMDSPSVFAALLDEAKGGRFSVQPSDPWDSVQSYLPQTNSLRTLFRTRSGKLELIDCMPLRSGEQSPGDRLPILMRRLTARQGVMKVRLDCSPRFDYARRIPRWSRSGMREWFIKAGEETLSLHATADLIWREEQAEVELQPGQTLWLSLYHGAEAVPLQAADLQRLLESTLAYWVSWTQDSHLGKYPISDFWQQALDRSALVLKLLQFEETGAIAAAPTTSLPAILYENRNWDYRFSWIRDTSMTLLALAELGHLDEVKNYLKWIKGICQLKHGGVFPVAYQIHQTALPSGESILPHLSGYKGSAPVRIGQFVVHQRQHDVYGELLDTLFTLSRFVGKIDAGHWALIRPLIDKVCAIWPDPDDGIWEMRLGPRHYTHSKLLCWVALDRGIKIAEHYGLPGDLVRWSQAREAIRREILDKGFNIQRNSFTQHYQTEAVDAALLLIPLMGFLPVDDPRVAGTIKAVEEDLWEDGVLLRYRMDDGLTGQERGFLICLFWYLNCLIMQGRLNEVEEHLHRVGAYSNHLGLFGEQFDPEFQEILGNFPQAYSHIGYAITVLNYFNARHPVQRPEPMGILDKLRLAFKPRLLNAAGPEKAAGDVQLGQEIKRTMNILRGLFYDGHHQCVDYERIRQSGYYQKYRQTVSALACFDPGSLKTDAERIAFWVNVYNAFVIHGVVDLEVVRSVKEVPRFFSRIQYMIGGRLYTPDDIEHGILRGNARPPFRLFSHFSRRDPRLRFRVRQLDPRIHFALVCASRTCPPIEVYEAENLDRQLDTSAQVFINSTTRLDKKRRVLKLSEIFRWYRRDFNLHGPALPRYLADYLYNQENAKWLKQYAEELRIHYEPYDWRLNR